MEYSQFGLLHGEIVEIEERTDDLLGFDTYTVRVFWPNGQQSIVVNAISCIGSIGGGIHDYVQITHRPIMETGDQPSFNGDSDDLSSVGERVLVGFISGDMRRPVIVARFPHPMQTIDLPDPESQDVQAVFQLNGMRIEIHPSGKFVMSHYGAPEVNPGGTSPNYDDAVATTFSIEDDGSWYIVDSEAQTLHFNRTDKIITLENGDDSIELDKNTNTLTIVVKGEVKVSAEKDVTIDTKGAATVNVEKDCAVTVKGEIHLAGNGNTIDMIKDGTTVLDSNGNKIEMTSDGCKISDVNSNNIEMTSSSVTVTASSKAVVDAPQIELTAGAAEGLIKGQSFTTFFNAHTHPTATGPSGPPVIPMDPSLVSVKVKTG